MEAEGRVLWSSSHPSLLAFENFSLRELSLDPSLFAIDCISQGSQEEQNGYAECRLQGTFMTLAYAVEVWVVKQRLSAQWRI